jgi:hypothetical protein
LRFFLFLPGVLFHPGHLLIRSTGQDGCEFSKIYQNSKFFHMNRERFPFGSIIFKIPGNPGKTEEASASAG